MQQETLSIITALMAYTVGTASPGPATLTIVTTAASHGRREALVLASGILAGSFVWGFAAMTGFALLLPQIASFLFFLKIAGGLYLLWLAYKSFKVALSSEAQMLETKGESGRFFIKGLLLHLTNPKNILTWSAVLTIGVTEGSSSWLTPMIFVGCSFMGGIVFGGYALLFSTPKAMEFYQAARQKINAIAGTIFGVAGIKLLSSRA